MKTKIMILLVGAMVTGMLTACNNDTTEATETTDSEYEVSMETYADTDNVQISYPVISNWSDEDAQDTWNETFKQIVETEYEAIGDNDVVDMQFEVTQQDSDILSIELIADEFWEGAAHTYAYCVGYVIDMNTGNQLTLSDYADTDEIADTLLNTDDYTIQTDGLTIDDILEYSFGDETPDVSTLSYNLAVFGETLDDTSSYQFFGSFYVEDENVVLVAEVNHAMGDYVCITIDN